MKALCIFRESYVNELTFCGVHYCFDSYHESEPHVFYDTIVNIWDDLRDPISLFSRPIYPILSKASFKYNELDSN